ncbi:MAG: hypothetical protein FJ299_01155 [Planctomycetes bacterium]|nr:hypothetical protein [Planctomycetota bacterium]
MNSKNLLVIFTAVIVVAGSAAYFLGRRAENKSSVVTPNKVPTAVEAAPLRASLEAAPAPVAAAPAPQPAEDVAPGIVRYANPAGDITFDRNSKHLSQTKKMIIRRGDGTQIERDVQITATPGARPLSAVPRLKAMVDQGKAARGPKDESSTKGAQDPAKDGAQGTGTPASGAGDKPAGSGNKPFVK